MCVMMCDGEREADFVGVGCGFCLFLYVCVCVLCVYLMEDFGGGGEWR